jgi:hypothetical protein
MKLAETWLKVERATRHIVELRHEIARIESGPYELVEIRDEASGDRTWVLHAKDAAQHLLGLSMYGVIIGDFVHNLRSALDHAVWKLAAPPIEGLTGFPVCLEERDRPGSFFGGKGTRAKGRNRLKNVPKPAFDFIERVQPYNRMQATAPLWQLNEMWNEDKHRTLLVVEDFNWTSQFSVSTLHGRDLYEGEMKPTDPENPLEVFRLDAASDSEVTVGRPSNLSVRFGSPEVVEGLAILPTLEWMLKDISQEILAGLESFLP